MAAIFSLCLSGLIINSGLPEVRKWFFDEIKYRATTELREIDPIVNLAAIWEQTDEWQKESDLIPKEMTNQKLKEYVLAAKQLILKEEGLTTV